MLRLTCQCGETIDLPISFMGEAADCPLCGKSLRAVAGISLQEGENVTARLAISRGPERIGEQFFLAGGAPIDIGKLPEKHIALMGAGMSRNHCRLIPFNGGWTLEDQKSTNGLFVNGARVQRAELHGGDIIQVGEYELRYESFVESHAEATEVSPADDYGAYELAGIDIASVESMGRIIPDAPFVPQIPKAFSPEPLRAAGSGPECPCCAVVLAPKASICVTCGIKVPSGRPLATSRGMDESFLYERTNTWLQLVSFIMGIGLLPVASEAFGTKKARSVWVIFGITFLASAMFLAANRGEPGVPRFGNLKLWAGSDAMRQKNLDTARRTINELLPKPAKNGSKRSAAPKRPLNGEEDFTPDEVQEIAREFERQVAAQSSGEFHVYQLFTHALLHQGVLHFAGNMVFLLVFGLRVNELIGDLMFAIVYPLLAVAAALAYMASIGGQPLHSMLGASGAVMGLAGMYFVLFPVQRVHMVFWIRFFWFTGLYLKMFRMRGFWLLVMWIGLNDLLPMAFAGPHDHVAHWAHLGGFLSGMAVAIILLATRLATARGADLLSFALGKYAWPLLGRPNSNLEAPIASAARRRLGVPTLFSPQ